MTDPSPSGLLVLTGASGTVGSALIHVLAPTWHGDLLALGRTCTQPGEHRPIRFIPVDLADPTTVGQVSTCVAAGPPVGALICAAGMDARARLCEFNPDAAAACMQVNAWAHVQLLNAALTSHTNVASTTLPVVLVSSDATPLGLALLIVRLPDIGVPMRTAAPGPPPPPRTGSTPRPVLAAAAGAVASFLTAKHQRTSMEVWHA